MTFATNFVKLNVLSAGLVHFVTNVKRQNDWIIEINIITCDLISCCDKTGISHYIHGAI